MATTPSARLPAELPSYAMRSDSEDLAQRQTSWIAIEPVVRGAPSLGASDAAASVEQDAPPSFTESRFDVILRRQRQRPPEGGGLKQPQVPASRFLNLSSSFEFAGWGSLIKLKLTSQEHAAGEERLQNIRRGKVLGQWLGSAIPGNDLLGSVFYALPAVVLVSGVYSPISLFVATLTLFLWRPIMGELVAALPLSGAPYSYLLNTSRKSLALVGAALMVLDFTSTSVVSAATASSYITAEIPPTSAISHHLPPPALTLLILTTFATISLSGLKDSARVSAAVLAYHALTMVVLALSACIRLGLEGRTISVLAANWREGSTGKSLAVVTKQIFEGFCLGMLDLTGIECTPSYAPFLTVAQSSSPAKPAMSTFARIQRNVHLPIIVLNGGMMLLLLSLVPLSEMLGEDGNGNLLSLLRTVRAVGPRWILPAIFLSRLPVTDAPHVSLLAATLLNAVFYASAGMSVVVVSKMFSLAWLTLMGVFPLALLLMRFNRGRLIPHCASGPRKSTRLSTIFATFLVTIVVFAGNIAIDASTAGYFAAYLLGVLFVFGATQNKIAILRAIYWVYDQYPGLHRFTSLGESLVRVMTRLRGQPVCILVKGDEINLLLHMILYVRENEDTSCVKIVHFCGRVDDEESMGVDLVPSELEANAKILDEAFPEITIDLIIIQDTFTSASIGALAQRLGIPPALMFIRCPGPRPRCSVAEMGVRIISR
uniref:AAAP amino acid permease n=1 Tax=Mycena chlorophos TaxID=658473 RepID=A0ABQ0LWU9_MYCCL|nr:AAAP amino acid permease [Mycena chlorophos]